MVSVPDWARFARMLESRPIGPTQQSRYLKQRESETIRQAEEQGYFLNASKSFIEDHFAALDEACDKDSLLCAILGEEKKKKDLQEIEMIKLSRSHLRNVGDIGLCENLRICILSNNYIKRFEDLAPCINLMRLDLHGNQISVLPGASFWNNMIHLRILHLHDNPIGKIENLQNLAACPCLFLLTLFDTPLSLKRNYRHHVVNSIWSLKALDNFVISDEEIIEDAEFSGCFSALHPSFAIDLCPPSKDDASFEEEFYLACGIITKVNKILAHFSPVLMIQKHIRGCLTRRRFKLVQDMRICEMEGDGAAVTIQRGFRDYKGLPNLADATSTPPPPTSPTNITMHSSAPMQDSMKIDFDTYLRNRRPGSTGGGSELSISSRQPSQRDKIEVNESQGTDGRKRKNIFINLTKLQSGTLQSLQDEAVAIETIFPADGTFLNDGSRKSESPNKYKRKNKEKKRKVIKSVKQFFGPVVDRPPTPETDRKEEEEDIPLINFRLRGIKKEVRYVDPMTDLIMSKRELGHEVRMAESIYHKQADNVVKPIIQRKKISDLQRYAKLQGNMGLSCLRAVQQAYKDRNIAERTAIRSENVMRMKDQRDAAKDRTKMFYEEKRRYVLKDRELEQKKILDTMEKRELMQLNHYEKKNERKLLTSHFARHRKGELTFISDFNVQNTSVSNALMRHDRQAQQEDRLQEKADIVLSQKSVEKEQQEIVRKYLEHRQLMRQTESAMARASMDTRMLQEANERLMQARTRVAQKKARQTNVSNSQGGLPSIAKTGGYIGSQTPHNDMRWGAESAGGGAFITQPPMAKATTVA